MEIGCRHYGQRSVDLCNGPGPQPVPVSPVARARPRHSGDGTRHKFELARLFDVRSTRGERPRVAVKREQAHCVNRARSLDVLRINVAARFHHDVRTLKALKKHLSSHQSIQRRPVGAGDVGAGDGIEPAGRARKGGLGNKVVEATTPIKSHFF